MVLALNAIDRVESKTIAGIHVNETKTSDMCFRLVHDTKKIITYFESEGFTITGNKLFIGTKKECNNEIKRLKIKAIEPILIGEI